MLLKFLISDHESSLFLSIKLSMEIFQRFIDVTFKNLLLFEKQHHVDFLRQA